MSFVNFDDVYCESLTAKEINYTSLNKFNIGYINNNNYVVSLESNFDFLYSSNDYIYTGELIFGDKNFQEKINTLNKVKNLYNSIYNKYLLIDKASNYPTSHATKNSIAGNNTITFIEDIHDHSIEQPDSSTKHNAGNDATIYHYKVSRTGAAITTISDAVNESNSFTLKFPYIKISCFKKINSEPKQLDINESNLNNINCNKINNTNTCTISDRISVYNKLIIKDIMGTENVTFEQKIYDMLFPINSIKIFHDYKGTDFEYNKQNIKSKWSIITHNYIGLMHTAKNQKNNELTLKFDESNQAYFYSFSLYHTHSMYTVSTKKKLLGGNSGYAYDKDNNSVVTGTTSLAYKMSLPNYISIYLYKRIN